MNNLLDTILILLVLSNLVLLGSSRLMVYVRGVALQGIMLALLPLLFHGGEHSWHRPFLAAVTMVLKGGVFPWLLGRSLIEVRVRREIEPYVGPIASLLCGAALFALSLWYGTRLVLPNPLDSRLVVPVAMFTTLVGLFLLVTRKNALTQVIGYIVLENGIYTFGIALMRDEPMMVELAILLDIFVAVFVMGITLFQINRVYEDLDTNRLASLHD